MPRKLPPNAAKPRDEMSPAARGYVGIQLAPELGARFDAWCEAQGAPSRPAGVRILLDQVAESTESDGRIDWERVQDVLVSHLGWANRDKAHAIADALKAALE